MVQKRGSKSRLRIRILSRNRVKIRISTTYHNKGQDLTFFQDIQSGFLSASGLIPPIRIRLKIRVRDGIKTSNQDQVEDHKQEQDKDLKSKSQS